MAKRVNALSARHATDMPSVEVTRESLRQSTQVFTYLAPYRGRFLAALAALLISTALSLTLPYLAGSLIDAALPAERLPQTVVLSSRINRGVLLLLSALALQAVFSFFQVLFFAQVGQSGLADLRQDTYNRLVRLPMAFFSQRRVGELASRISADLIQLEDTLVATLPQLMRQGVVFFGGIALVAVTSVKLTFVMLSMFPALIAVAVLFGRTFRGLSREAQDRLAESGTIVEETLQGIASVKAFANEDYESNRYRQSIGTFLRVVLRGAKYRAAFGAFVIFALFGAMVLVLWSGLRLLQFGELTAGELARFMLCTIFMAGAMGQFADLFSEIQRAVGATQRVRELLREEPERGLSASARPPAAIQRLRGEVAFEEVSFSYPSRREVCVLKAMTWRARPGERIALVGPSGGGKSTLIALLLRFYQPDVGRILIDGRDAAEYPLPALRAQMAVVPQDVLLFGGSIAENIAYGKPSAGDEEIHEAARKANVHDVIQAFPDRYRTLVGDRAVKLSGGERQRVAIARAILRDPAILILDEATSALDSENERLVQSALEVLMEGRTTFIIAHRLATIRNADKIIVVQDGRAVESGTHEELQGLENGLYRRLSALQCLGTV